MILGITCNDLSFILNIVKYLFRAMQWVIPIFLVALITFDVLKAMIAGDEKKSKEATGKAVKRIMYAVIIFLLPILIRIIFNNIPISKDALDCFNQYF